MCAWSFHKNNAMQSTQVGNTGLRKTGNAPHPSAKQMEVLHWKTSRGVRGTDALRGVLLLLRPQANLSRPKPRSRRGQCKPSLRGGVRLAVGGFANFVDGLAPWKSVPFWILQVVGAVGLQHTGRVTIARPFLQKAYQHP